MYSAGVSLYARARLDKTRKKNIFGAYVSCAVSVGPHKKRPLDKTDGNQSRLGMLFT